MLFRCAEVIPQQTIRISFMAQAAWKYFVVPQIGYSFTLRISKAFLHVFVLFPPALLLIFLSA